MEYRRLGKAGVKVSPLCLGCMNFGWTVQEEESIRIIHRALDEGINFIDTADVYAKGLSEQIVGKAIRDRRDKVVLATKVWGAMGEGPNDRGNARYHIVRAAEASLGRLKTDYIDLYQLHRPDPDTPIEETLRAMDDLVRQGKVLYVGTSTFSAWQLAESWWVAEVRNFDHFVCEQPPYSIFERRVETEVLPFCSAYGIAVIPWSPLAGGWLTGKYQEGKEIPKESRGALHKWDLRTDESKRRFDAIRKLTSIAGRFGKTLSQFSLAWLLANPAVTAPIIGPRTIEQLEDNLGALGLKLTQKELEEVDKIVAPGESI